MFSRRQVLFSALAAVTAPRLLAAEHRVSNPQELSAAIRAALPGDTIVMADGDWSDCDILFRSEGAPDAPVTLRAETLGKVVLRGRSRLRIGGSYLVADGLTFKDGYTPDHVVAFRADSRTPAHHCRLTRCAIVDYNPPDRDANTKWVSLFGTHNRVDHCYFSGKTDLGTTLVVWLSEEPNYHRIDRNHFGARPPLGVNGGETIRVGTSDWSMSESATTVELNYFEECNGEVEIVSNKSCGNVYLYNTFVNCQGALTLRHGNRCLVEGNFFFGNRKPATGGVRVIGEDHVVVNNYFAELEGDGSRSALTLMNGIPESPLAGYYQVKRALVAFNTFVNCRWSILIGRAGDSLSILPPEDCVLANNLIVGERAPLIRQETAAASVSWEGNIAYGEDTGIPAAPGLHVADPQLAPAAGGLWRPAPESIVRGAAQGEYGLVVEDIDGQPRPAPKDVGCDQLSAAPVLRRPLTAKDVGPAGAEAGV